MIILIVISFAFIIIGLFSTQKQNGASGGPKMTETLTYSEWMVMNALWGRDPQPLPA